MSWNLALCPRRGLGQRSGPRRPRGPEWVVPGLGRTSQDQYAKGSPTPAPTLPLQGRARSLCSLVLLRLSAVVGWLGTRYTLRYTHPYTRPQYPPGAIPSAVHRCYRVPGTVRACAYDRSGPVLGEPRGSRTQPVFRVPDWFIELREVHTAV